jgi:hypothetical protein
MSCRCRFVFLLVLVLIPACATTTLAAVRADQDLWYSLFFQSVHSGYSHIVSTSDVWNGRKATKEVSQTITKLNVFGASVEQDIDCTSYSDPTTGQPFYQTFKIASGGSVTEVSAYFTPHMVSSTLKSGTEVTKKVLPIPPGEKIVDGDTEGIETSGPLRVGQKEVDLEFDPVSLSLDKQVSTVQAVNVPLKDARDGLVHATARVFVSDPEGDATAYQDNAGTPILVLMPAGLVMICTDHEHATNGDNSQASYAADPAAPANPGGKAYDPAPDLAVATAVSPTGVLLQNERSLVSLTVRVTIKGQEPKTITETAIAVPPPNSSTIASLAADNSKYLAAAPYLSVDDPAIKKTALQIIGTESNSYAAVKLIHDWVYAHMSPVGTLGLPRSAGDILSNPQGVCRDYAVLYTSLARAAGIPTKIDAGLVGYHGRFYYHAWATSYIGGSVGWLPIDPTMPGMFVDASHIALGTGDATVMFELSDVIGNTKVETVSLRNSL